MNKRIHCMIFCLLLMVTMVTFQSRTEAANVDWYATNVYYEKDNLGYHTGVLVVEGYFTNNTDRYINYFYEFNLKVNINNGKKIVNGKFKNFEKMIHPHSDSSIHRFRIRNVTFISIDDYNVTIGSTRWKYSNNAG